MSRVASMLFDEAEGAAGSAKLRAFRSFVLLHGAARSWCWLHVYAQTDPVSPLLTAVLTGCLLLSLAPRYAHWAPRIALPALALQLLGSLPTTDNHFGLEFLCVAILCVVRRDDEEGERLALGGVRVLTAVVLFHTGLQKVLHGQYFHGEFLAYMVGQGGRFADFFSLLLPEAEVLRLQSYPVFEDGAGPFRTSALPFVLASNAVYLIEMGLAPLLLVPRTRTWAALAAVAFVLGLQLAAREVGFALLFSGILLVFFARPVNRWLLPLQALIYLWAVGATYGFLPGRSLMAGGSL